MKIFLDDIRQPQDCVAYMHTRIGKDNPIYLQDWLIVRNFAEFTEAVEKNFDDITHVSFDHDLADEHYSHPSDMDMDYADLEHNDLYNLYKEKTGLDCAVWLNSYYLEKKKPLPILYVHSMNPVGTQNIINVFK